MKIAYVFAVLAPTALAASWNYCACQAESGSSKLVDSATQKCCTAGTMKALVNSGERTSQMRFPGNYCDANDKHDGDAFFNCCKGTGQAADSACINWF